LWADGHDGHRSVSRFLPQPFQMLPHFVAVSRLAAIIASKHNVTAGIQGPLQRVDEALRTVERQRVEEGVVGCEVEGRLAVVHEHRGGAEGVHGCLGCVVGQRWRCVGIEVEGGGAAGGVVTHPLL